MFNTEEMTLDQFAEAMKPRTITGYLIDVQNETHGPRTIEKSLQGYFRCGGYGGGGAGCCIGRAGNCGACRTPLCAIGSYLCCYASNGNCAGECVGFYGDVGYFPVSECNGRNFGWYFLNRP